MTFAVPYKDLYKTDQVELKRVNWLVRQAVDSILGISEDDPKRHCRTY